MTGPAADAWRAHLASWAIPEDILAAAPVSPWGFSVASFTDRARRQQTRPTPAHDLARAALPDAGRVLDVGCGGGAASLPLVPPAAHLTGVDTSSEMLAAYREAGEGVGATVAVVAGEWPDVAGEVPTASHDVVVAQDVLYNVPDAAGFAQACDRVAGRRVVLVLPEAHPMSWTTPYWRALHGLDRPTRPTVDDAVAVLAELDLTVHQAAWTEPTLWAFASRDDAVATVRTRLCLPADRDEEVRRLLGDLPPPTIRRAVALWWDLADGNVPPAVP